MFIDPDGRDVVVLLAPGGANGKGHMGVLIGNDKTGWTYMSKDGTTWWGSKEIIGPSVFTKPDQKFATLEEFQKSNYILREKPLGNGQPYTQAIHFKTDTKQDEKAMAAMERAGKSYYGLLSNNCTDAVSNAVGAAGLNPGWSVYAPVYNDHKYHQVDDKSPVPIDRFKKMSENNNAPIIPFRPIEQQNKNKEQGVGKGLIDP